MRSLEPNIDNFLSYIKWLSRHGGGHYCILFAAVEEIADQCCGAEDIGDGTHRFSQNRLGFMGKKRYTQRIRGMHTHRTFRREGMEDLPMPRRHAMVQSGMEYKT